MKFVKLGTRLFNLAHVVMVSPLAPGYDWPDAEEYTMIHTTDRTYEVPVSFDEVQAIIEQATSEVTP